MTIAPRPHLPSRSARRRCAVTSFLCLLQSLVFLMATGNPASADYYTYKDGTGTVHMTNKLDAVAQKYRATMKVTKEDPPKPGSAVQSPVEEPPPAQASAVQPKGDEEAKGLLSRPWVKPVVFLCGIAAAFLMVTRLARLLPSASLARLVYLAFFLGVFVFGYTVYARHLVDGYFTIKQKVVAMFKNANQREAPATEKKGLTAEGDVPPGR